MRQYKKASYKGKTYYYIYILDENGKRKQSKKITEEEYYGGHKLATKKGKLTKYGEAYKKSIKNNKEMDEVERNYLLDRLEVYIRERVAEGKSTTLSSWKSRIKDTQLERMFYNLNTSAEEIAKQTGYDIDEVLNAENWNFKNNTFKDFQFEYDYNEYYGYKLTRRK